MTDPYRPASSFPTSRFTRAGLPAATIEALQEHVAGLGNMERRVWLRSITSASGTMLAERYGLPDDPADLSPDDHTAAQLTDLATAAGVGHSGTKAEVVERIRKAITARAEQATGDDEDDDEGEPQKTPQGDDKAPETPEGGPVGPDALTGDASGGTTPAGDPAPTPAATPDVTPASSPATPAAEPLTPAGDPSPGPIPTPPATGSEAGAGTGGVGTSTSRTGGTAVQAAPTT